MDCPVCESTDTRRDFQVRGFDILACAACGHRFADHAPGPEHAASVYGDSYFTDGGAGYEDYDAEADDLRERGRFYGSLLERHARPGRVLDVGAASGHVMAGLEDRGWTAVGLEPNATMVARARARGATMIHGTLEALPPGERFDAVTLIQVLPHLYDVRSAVRRAARAVRPGGLCLVETWDRESLVARAWGASWHEYSPPSVLHWFSRSGVTTLLGAHGLSLVDGGRPPRRIQGQHARSLLQHVAHGHWWGPLLTGASRLIPPGMSVPYPGDDLMWLLLRRA